MKTVKEIAKLTGISIRTLRYYDEIGLLKPAKVSEAGYRLYDEQALAKLQEILFYKELGLSLADIRSVLEDPEYDREQMLLTQKRLLEQKRNRLNSLIELIDDRRKGVNAMNFELFTEEDIQKIFDHTLELQTEEDKKLLVEQYGSLEAFRKALAETMRTEEYASQMIQLYGSKDKAVAASLQSDGDRGAWKEQTDETDRIYRQFARAMETGDAKLAEISVRELAENSKNMFRMDNARHLLLKIAEDYLNHSALEKATDEQYGAGVTRFIGQAIRQYYGEAVGP